MKVLLASLTNVMSIDTVEDLGRRRHLVKANLGQDKTSLANLANYHKWTRLKQTN